MRVTVLGCGYVGLELGRQLRADGHDVVGVRRSESGLDAVDAAGLTPVEADVTEAGTLDAVPDCDWLVFAASTGGGGPEAAKAVYVDGVRTVLDHFAARTDPPERFVYTSSTGVYGDHDGAWVDESTPLDPTTEKTTLLVEAERVALDRSAGNGIDGTVARFAGLYGPERYRLDRYLNGPVTEGILNMVHRDDAAGAVAHVLTADLARDEVVLVVDDEPVSKWAFADWLAAQCGVPAPPKQTKTERLDRGDLSVPARRRIRSSKRCSNAYLRSLGYECRFPTFRQGYRAAIEALGGR